MEKDYNLIDESRKTHVDSSAMKSVLNKCYGVAEFSAQSNKSKTRLTDNNNHEQLNLVISVFEKIVLGQFLY